METIMSGCYGNSPEDRYFESKLLEYLDSQDYDDSPEFEAEQQRQFQERMGDIDWVLESFTEAKDERLKELGEALALPPDEKSSIRIGDIVRQIVEDYAMPTDDEVLEVLNTEPGDPRA